MLDNDDCHQAGTIDDTVWVEGEMGHPGGINNLLLIFSKGSYSSDVYLAYSYLCHYSLIAVKGRLNLLC